MSKKSFINWIALIFFVLLCLDVNKLVAQPTENFLFRPAPDKSGTINLRTGPEVIDKENIVFSSNLLASNQPIQARLFGNTITIRPINNKLSPSDRFSWWGSVVGDPNSYVLFSRSGDIYTGDIWWKNVLYQIRYVGKDLYQTRKIDQSKYPADESPEPRKEIKLSDNQPISACANVDPPTQIDVMVLYTDLALDAAGDQGTIESEIQQAVLVTNFVYENSDISQRIELVYMARIDFSESRNSHTDLTNLQNSASVLALRDDYAADIVVLIVDSLDYCGEADVMTKVTADFEKYAYAVVKRSCMISDYSLTHELGHIMGARHDCCVDYSDQPFNDAHGFGYILNDTTYAGTIMSVKGYSDMKENTRLPNFSNPASFHDGQRLGVYSPTEQPGLTPNTNPTCPYSGDEIEGACYANNSRVLNATALTVANFRCRSSRTAEVWMKDTWVDSGVEPNEIEEDVMNSPAIWVRNQEDKQLIHTHQHQNPYNGKQNWVYVKLHNGSKTPVKGILELYYADASKPYTWPNAWSLLGSVPVKMSNSGSQIIAYPWNVSSKQVDYSLLAKWASADDSKPAQLGEDWESIVRKNNNVVCKSLKILDLTRGKPQTLKMNLEALKYNTVELDFKDIFPNQSFLNAGSVEISFSHLAFTKPGIEIKGSGFKALRRNLFLATESKVVFENLRVDQKQQGSITLTFKQSSNSSKRKFYGSIKQRSSVLPISKLSNPTSTSSQDFEIIVKD